MATKLFFLNTVPDTHRGTNTAKRDGTASGWKAYALGLSQGSGSLLSGTSNTVTGATNGVEVGQSTGVPFEWISEPVAADVTISGTITANIWAFESNMSANVAINVIIDIIRATTSGADGANTIQNIVQSTRVTEADSTASAVNNFTTGMTSGGYTGQTLNRGDRLRVRIVGDDVGTMAATYTFSATVNGSAPGSSGDSYVTFTENITFERAPGSTVGTDTSVLGGNSIFGRATGVSEAEGQSFVANGQTLTQVKARLYKTGSPTDNAVLTIETDSSGSPSGSSVGTVGTTAGTTLTTTDTEYTFSGLSIALTAGTTYWLVYRRDGALSDTNYYRLGTVAVATLAAKYYASGAWSSLGANTLNASLTMTNPFTVYLTDTASAVSTASVDREAWTSRGAGVQTDVRNTAAGWTAPLQLTDTAGGTVVDWFTRPLTAFTLTGMAVANIRAASSSASANDTIRCEIARVEGDGTSPTVWASWCIAPTGTDNGELATSEAARTCNVSGDDLAITDGQRLRIRLYSDDMSAGAMATSFTTTVYYAGTSAAASGDTYITFPQTLTEYSVAGPTQLPFVIAPVYGDWL